MKAYLHRYKVVAFMLMLLLSCSCKKKEGPRFSTIDGYVGDYYTNEPLSHIGLIIEECKIILIGPTICTILDTFYSENSGFFHYDLVSYYPDNLLDVRYFQLSVITSDFYANNEVTRVNIGEKNNFDFKIKPLKTLKIYLSDTSFIYDELRIIISESHYYENNQFYQKMTLLNPSGYDFVLFNFKPETDHSITWKYYIVGELKGYQYVDKYFENNDTSYLEIKY